MNLKQLQDHKKPKTLVTNLEIFSPLVKFMDGEGEFPFGSIITITGEPGTGKTRYALQVLEDIATWNDAKTMLYSYEMGPAEIAHVCKELSIKRIGSVEFKGIPKFEPGTVCMIDSLDGLARQEYNSEWPPSELADAMLEAKKKGATIILIHHTTKGGRKRSGSVNFAKDNDVTVNLRKKGTGVVASAKEKCRWPGQVGELELEHTRKGLRIPPPPSTMWEHAVNLIKKMQS